MTRDQRTLRRLLDERGPRDWPRIAELMGWSPEQEVPSWMTPPERERFWREVDEANRRALVDRELASLRAELEATFSRSFLWLAGVIGRVQRWVRR
ncbi:MAG TPA: hypothetical protein VGQ64_07945 [Candidatus Limnocylindrales bacterium]|jgi:hypothetical protein|nr:hypothetical protein [Candidatus Limnocylindrales bacterium]